MSCASSCKTQDHPSYGACLRSKGLAVTGLESTNPSFSRDRSKAWDSELDLYESAVKQGIQPETTERRDIEFALEKSQQTGTAFRADETQPVLGANADG
jgi:hypothetical protein